MKKFNHIILYILVLSLLMSAFPVSGYGIRAGWDSGTYTDSETGITYSVSGLTGADEQTGTGASGTSTGAALYSATAENGCRHEL